MSVSGGVYMLKLVTCLGDVSRNFEARGGTTNAAPDRATCMLI